MTATEVQIESEPLDDGVPLVYQDHGVRVRIAFDPRQISETSALRLLAEHLPHLADAAKISHPTGS